MAQASTTTIPAEVLNRVVLVFPTMVSYGTGVAESARAELTRRGSYKFRRLVNIPGTPSAGEFPPDCMGMITFAGDPDQVARLKALPFPVVNVSARLPDAGLPTVTMDNRAIGRLGAEHLLARGNRRLVYASTGRLGFDVQRRRGFVEAARAAGAAVRVLSVKATPKWLESEARAVSIMAASGLPVGVMARGDSIAMRVISGVLNAGLRVPEDVAVLGVDNDQALCESFTVPISSVDPSAKRIGVAAVELMCDSLRGQPVDARPVMVRPSGVDGRASTARYAVDDAHVAAALDFIADHAFGPITVEDILERVPISRRALEYKFASALGRTPHAEVHRVRVARAKQNLSTTDLPVEQIAAQCGYTHLGRFYRRFKEDTGHTPGEYRRLQR